MVRFLVSLITLLILGAVAAPLKRDVAGIKESLTKVHDRAVRLVEVLDNFASAGPANPANKIRIDHFEHLIVAVATVTSDITINGPLSESDGQVILAQMKSAIQPTLIAAIESGFNNQSRVIKASLFSYLKALRSRILLLESSLSDVLPVSLSLPRLFGMSTKEVWTHNSWISRTRRRLSVMQLMPRLIRDV